MDKPPCDACPVHLWKAISDPTTATAEAAIRADATRLMRRSLDRAQERITRLEDEVRRLRAANTLAA